jgi:hypothetical protein
VPTSSGLRLVARTRGLELFRLTSGGWSRESASQSALSGAMPSAVALGSGEVLVALDASGGTQIVRFSSTGSAARVEQVFRGYRQPSIASDGERAWVAMVSDSGALVSRERSEGSGWSSVDRVEITSGDAGHDLAWPNLVRDVDDRLRLVVDGPRCPERAKRNWVLAYQRDIAATPAPQISVSGARVAEGDASTVDAVFKVTLSEASASPVQVRYATADGSATRRHDYRSSEGVVEFVPGDRAERVTVLVDGDTRPESDETFAMILSSASNASIERKRATATIVDDDLEATRTTLWVRRKPGRLHALGSVRPSTGGRMVVELARRENGSFEVLAVRRPRLITGGAGSTYRARLWRPKRGLCRVTATYPGDGRRAASKARQRFRCGGR